MNSQAERGRVVSLTMGVLNLVGELSSGVALMLFVPMAVLVIGTPIVLVARLLIELIERF
jgi:hypothetical protein